MAQEQRVSARRYIRNRLIGGISLYLLAWLLLREYLKIYTIWIDLLLFLLLFVGWIFFFSQFLLPVQGSGKPFKDILAIVAFLASRSGDLRRERHSTVEMPMKPGARAPVYCGWIAPAEA